MLFKPQNRYLLVEPHVAKKRETNILLPEDYETKKEEYVVVEVKDRAPDCKVSCSAGSLAVVQARMVEEMVVQGKKYHLVLENYVLGTMAKAKLL